MLSDFTSSSPDGLGTGALTGIVPVFCSEVSESHHRGAFLGYVFIVSATSRDQAQI